MRQGTMPVGLACAQSVESIQLSGKTPTSSTLKEGETFIQEQNEPSNNDRETNYEKEPKHSTEEESKETLENNTTGILIDLMDQGESTTDEKTEEESKKETDRANNEEVEEEEDILDDLNVEDDCKSMTPVPEIIQEDPLINLCISKDVSKDEEHVDEESCPNTATPMTVDPLMQV